VRLPVKGKFSQYAANLKRTFETIPGGDRASVGYIANLTLLALWLWFYRPVYPYLAIIFTRQEFRTNQILLISILVLFTLQLRKGLFHPRLNATPQWNPAPLLLTLGGSTLFVLVERFLDINTLSASLFGLASYGLLGLWMSPPRWRKGLPAALLLIGALPFGEHMQTFIGYPVRLLTAAIVRDGLAVLGVHSIGVETILVFENGISQVDLPCSGVQSLWTGGLFLLAATWIERRPLNLRWIGISLVFSLLLLAANLGRVGILVTVGEVAGWRLLAEMLHVPLGVLGFVAACATVISLLDRVGDADSIKKEVRTQETSMRPANPLPRPTWLRLVVAGMVLILAVFYSPRPQEAVAQAERVWEFSEEIQIEPWHLTTTELDWLSRGGALQGDRWRFQWQGTTGSLLFVTSKSWRAHHRPERCFEVYGLRVEGTRTYLMAPDFSMRLLTLGDERGHGLYTAAYWLQSTDQSTDDYATRIWADLQPQRQDWVLVTILFDDAYDPLSPDVQALYPALRQVVAHSLGGGTNP
jgi:exosortase O